MTEWQSIESAPKDGTLVDLWGSCKDGDGRWTGRFPDAHWGKLAGDKGYDWLDHEGLGLTRSASIGAVFTHWQPLPEPPDEFIVIPRLEDGEVR